MRIGKVLLSILAGVVTGILSGILFAPAKGRKTRKRLLTKGKDYSGELKEKSVKLFESIAVKFEKIMDDFFFDEKKHLQSEEEVLHDSQII